MTRPYFDDGIIQLYCGDFRDIFPELDVIPDLVIADPPYGETTLDWDTWPAGWPSQIPGNSMWCFGSMRMFLGHYHEFTDAGWRMSQDVVWEKNVGTGFVTDRFRRVHEHAVHFYRGPWGSVRHETPRIPSSHGTEGWTIKKGENRTCHTGSVGSGPDWVDNGTRLMGSVIRAPNMHKRSVNATEKPHAALEPLIGYGCPHGGLVMDPFAGSGSTLVAARALGRRAIGAELREEQCASAVAARMSQATLQFGP